MATFAAVLSGKRDYALYLDVNETAVDQANNRSQVSWSLRINKAYYYDNAWNNYHVCNWYVQVNGSTIVSSTKADYNFTTSYSVVLNNGSAWVAHNADGTGSATIVGHFGGTSALGSATVNGTIGLSNLIQSPDPVTSVTFTNSSIIRAGSWVNHPTPIKPYDTVGLTRYINGVANYTWYASGTTTTYGDSDFVNGYVQYSVVGINGAGRSTPTFSTIQVAAPTIIMTILSNPGTARISWQTPAITNGKTITGYKVRYFKSGPDDSAEVNVGASVTYLDVSIAAAQSIYAVVDTLVDGAYGPDSNSSNTATNTPNYPLAPGSVTVTTPIVTGSVAPKTSSVTVSWVPIVGADIHRVNVSPVGPLVAYGVGTATLSGMTPGVTYTLSVQAHNSYGWGASSGTLAVITPNVPSTPTITSLTSVVADGRPIIVSVYAVDNSAPANGYSPIIDVRYKVTSAGSTLVDWSTVTDSPMEIAGAIPGTLYTVSIKSINAVGESVAAIGAVTPIGGRIMVNVGGTWTPKYIKPGPGFATNAQVRVLGDGGRWGYTGI